MECKCGRAVIHNTYSMRFPHHRSLPPLPCDPFERKNKDRFPPRADIVLLTHPPIMDADYHKVKDALMKVFDTRFAKTYSLARVLYARLVIFSSSVRGVVPMRRRD